MSDQVTITLTKEQAENLKTFCDRGNLWWNTLYFYSEMFEGINDEASLSLSGWIVLTKTLRDAGGWILEESDKTLGPILNQLPEKMA